MKLLECAVMLRVYAMLASFLYGATAITQPEALVYRIAHATDFGLWTMYAMVVFAVLGWVDVLVNDLMPDRFSIPRALHDRHLVSMGLSLCFCVQMFVEVRYQLPLAVFPFYLIYVVMIPLSAFADIQKRYKKRAC